MSPYFSPCFFHQAVQSLTALSCSSRVRPGGPKSSFVILLRITVAT